MLKATNLQTFILKPHMEEKAIGFIMQRINDFLSREDIVIDQADVSHYNVDSVIFAYHYRFKTKKD